MERRRSMKSERATHAGTKKHRRDGAPDLDQARYMLSRCSISSVVKLVVDGRLTLVHGGTLSQRTIDVLYGAFTHQNPDYWKFKRLGFRGKPPEKQIFTARQGKEQMSFPRGGLVRLRELLQEHRIATEIAGPSVARGSSARGEDPAAPKTALAVPGGAREDRASAADGAHPKPGRVW